MQDAFAPHPLVPCYRVADEVDPGVSQMNTATGVRKLSQTIELGGALKGLCSARVSPLEFCLFEIISESLVSEGDPKHG